MLVVRHLIAEAYNYFLFAFKDVPLKEIEIERAQTMMRNARVFQSLGISTLASILNQSSAKSKGTAHEDKDPLYEPTGDENSDHGEVDKVFATI